MYAYVYVYTAIMLASYHPCIRLLFDARDLSRVKRYVLYYTSSRVLTPRYLLRGTYSAVLTVQDLSLVKSYVLQQCDKVRSGRVALQDFLIFSEVRGASGVEYAGTAPPHAQVAMARARADRRDAAEAGERIPYVVAHTRNAPINRLMESSRRPPTLLTTFDPLLTADYYLLTTRYPLRATHCPLPTARCTLPAARCPVQAARGFALRRRRVARAQRRALHHQARAAAARPRL